MEVFLRRALIDSEAALAAVDGVAGRRFANDVGRRGQPLLDVHLAVLALLIFDSADRLSRQERPVLARSFSSRLDLFRLNSRHAGVGH